MCMVGQLFCMAGFKYAFQETVAPWNSNDDVSLAILSKSVDGINEIVHSLECIFRIEAIQHLIQLSFLLLIFISELYIMIHVHINHMHFGIDHFQEFP